MQHLQTSVCRPNQPRPKAPLPGTYMIHLEQQPKISISPTHPTQPTCIWTHRPLNDHTQASQGPDHANPLCTVLHSNPPPRRATHSQATHWQKKSPYSSLLLTPRTHHLKKQSSNILHTEHIVPRCRSPNHCIPQQQVHAF